MIPTHEIEFAEKAIAEFVFSIGNAVRISNMFKNWANTILPHLDGEAREFLKEATDELRKLEPKEEEEIFYKVGDSFESINRIFELTHIGNNMIVLIEITTNPASYIWQTSYCRKVENTHKITQEEFSNISNHSQRLFELIK